MFLSLLLLLSLCRSQEVVSVNLLQQMNVWTRAFNVSNKLMCDEFTDVQPISPLYASDDFVLPLDSEIGVPLQACEALRLTLSVLLVQQGSTPGTLTLQFFTNNASGSGPAELFYSKTFSAPDPGAWQVTQAVATNITLTLSQGEPGDDGTPFDFGDTQFVQRHRTLWLAFYLRGAYTQGSIFWLTLDAAANSRRPQRLWSLANSQYFYRDVADAEQLGFTAWTAASVVEPVFEIASGTGQMAWALDALCPVANMTPTTQAPTRNTTTLERELAKYNGVAIALALFFCCCCFLCCMRFLRRRSRAHKKGKRPHASYEVLDSSEEEGAPNPLHRGQGGDDDGPPKQLKMTQEDVGPLVEANRRAVARVVSTTVQFSSDGEV